MKRRGNKAERVESVVDAIAQYVRSLQADARIANPPDPADAAGIFVVRLINGRWQLTVADLPADGGGVASLGIPPFTQSGAIVGATSPRWYAFEDTPITQVRISLQTAGTSATTVRVRRNGVVFDDYIIGTGVNEQTFGPANVTGVAAGEYIDTTIVSAGTAAADICVQFDSDA